MSKKKANLGSADLEVELILVPEQVKMLTVSPAMSIVRVTAKTSFASIIVRQEDFGADVKSAKGLFDNIKRCFQV